MHVADVTPGPGERHLIAGGMRTGKSGMADWCDREIRNTRPTCMALLLDTKPRFRAEMERGRFRRGRRDASYRYTGWAKGPVVPNSVVADIWDDHPFRNLWRPGELVIMQGGTAHDWRRMLLLLNEFVSRDTGEIERLVEVDELLDFTEPTRSPLIHAMTRSLERHAREANGISVCKYARRGFGVFRCSSVTTHLVSHCSIYRITQT